MATHWLRTRQFLNKQFALVAVACLGLALLGGWMAYGTHVDPGTHVEEQRVSSWATTAGFTHSATVRASNPVYSVGTTLENRTTYFSSVTPVLDAASEFEYSATGAGNLTATAETWLTFQRVSRDQSGEIETVYWRTTRELDRERAAGLAPGERFRVPHSVNVSELANRSEQIDEELGRTPGQTEASVRTTVTVNGTVNGDRVSHAERYSLPIEIGEVYRVRDPETVTSESESTRTAAVTNSYGPLRRIGSPLLVAVSLGVVTVLGIARRRGALELTPRERAHLAYRDDRSDFDEWISEIRLPDRATTRPRAEAESLADLVDFAIDTDNSVIEDPRTGTYHVFHDGRHYTYDPPSEPEREGPDIAKEDGKKPAGEGASEAGPTDPLSADSGNSTD